METEREKIVVVNAYGSFLEDDDNSGNDSGTSESSSDEGSEATKVTEVREYCQCKGKCCRKNGKGACVCRQNDLACHVNCSCNKNKCSNKANAEVQEQRRPVFADGEAAFEQELQQSQTEIEEFVESLDNAMRNQILIRILSMGRGSLDFARTLASGNAAEEEREEAQPQWCKCKVCKLMPNEEENVCCKRVTCVTCYSAFYNICLDRDILEVCIKARCDIRADDFNFSMECFRKAAYRQFALWRYGKLGRYNRRVLPACVVGKIRAKYPSSDGLYMGHKNH